MADEELVDNQKNVTEGETEPKKKSLFQKFTDYVEKDNEKWEKGGEKKAVQGKDLSAEEKGKIKNLAVDFWNSYGKDHQEDVESWVNHDKGQKLVKHFVNDGKCQDLYTNCAEYKNCFDAYQKEKGNTNYNYEESSVDFNRIQTPYDVSFYIVLDGFPEWMLSTTNQHTKNFVMSRFKEGDSILSIVKTANEKLGKKPTKEGDKDSQKEGNESENEEDKEQEAKTEEAHDEHEHEKHEFDVFCVKCAKKDLPSQIAYGNLSNQFNEYQRSFMKTFADSGEKISKEDANIFNNLKDKNFAEDFLQKNINKFDTAFLDKIKNNINKIDKEDLEKFNNNINKEKYEDIIKNDPKKFDNDINKVFDDYLKNKSNQTTQSGGVEKE